MTKIRRSITIDKEIWETLPYYINTSRSAFIEQCLRDCINANNDIESLTKEMEEDKRKIRNKQIKLDKLREIEEKNNKSDDILNNAMDTANNISKARGFITIQQIQFIANKNDINKDILTDKIKEEGIKISKFDDEIVESTKRNIF